MRSPTSRRALPLSCLLAAFSLLASPPAHAQEGTNAPSLGAMLERTLARVTSTTAPGCAIGVQREDLMVTRARGAADLERGVALTPSSIIEAGSVSKQFTAAAVLLLALDGAISLDDDVRRWFPELPEYEAPITVRHLLTHTSGLRDWGAIVQLEGWPRSWRAHTNAHVVHVAARQRTLNYTPGLAYSYTNTGYNLLAELVQRVSGRSLAAFTAERIFTPLGMSNTSWRDDHRRVVRGRALAYSGGTVPRLSMPDESAYGNGGLLTTAEDLLRWTAALERRTFGDAFADSLQQRMVLTGGDTIDYALGVNVLSHRGTPELSHSGSTGGYRAHLLAFPEQRTSVSVLCNGAGLNASQLAEQIADTLVGMRTRRAARPAPVRRPMALVGDQAALTASQYAQLAGTYASDEVRGEPLVITVTDGTLTLTQAPSTRLTLAPGRGRLFQAAGQLFWFDIDGSGRATALHVAQDRAWDVVFARIR